jgi:hypothetical protein
MLSIFLFSDQQQFPGSTGKIEIKIKVETAVWFCLRHVFNKNKE